MSQTKAKPKPRRKPQAAKPPRASMPPRAGAIFTRPVASTPAQRRKRRNLSGTLKASVNGDEAELEIFGTIGADWSGEGVTAAAFKQQLESLGDVATIRLTANSGGGDVFEATAIYNLLVQHPATIIVNIVGVAASAMTLIAMAGDEIKIAENAHFMIHRASGLAYGNADELRQYLKLLDNADALIRLTYERRTGLSDSDLVGLMDHDNWMTAAEALDLGFVDEVTEAKSAKPHISPATANDRAKPIQLDERRLAAMVSSLSAVSELFRVAATASKPGSEPDPHSQKDEEKMNAKLRAKCLAAGMPETLEGEAADKWFDDHADDILAVQPPAKPEPADSAIAAALKQALAEQAAERKAFRAEVDALLEIAFDKPAAELRAACYDLQDQGMPAVRTKIMEAKQAAPSVGSIRFSDSQPRERHLDAIKGGVQLRALGGLAAKYLPENQRPKDAANFAQMPLIKIAEQCLLADGFTYDQINRLPQPQLAMAALGFHRNAGLRADGALHTTGSLAEVTRDAMNKSLLAGYEEAPQTWRGPIRQAASVTDFKTIHRVKLSAVGNLPAWIDGLPPELAKLSNERESYAVQAFAETLSFSWQLYVNDDLDALSRTPQMLGNAAARTVNATAWGAVTTNPTMSDGQAFFLETPAGNRKRSNLTTGAASPTNITIAAMRTKMRLMRGLNTPEGAESQDILNLTPAYICLPTALEGLVTQQVNSSADPAASGNAGIVNLVKFWGLAPVVEPLLDANSSTAWYISAAPSAVDGVELSFLQGQETPFIHEWMDDATMCQNFSIIQTFAARAIDHRGWQKHAGA